MRQAELGWRGSGEVKGRREIISHNPKNAGLEWKLTENGRTEACGLAGSCP